MSLSSISIRRPVLAIVMSFVIVLFGAIGYTSLGVREYPSIDPPIITVQTNYTGANATVIESQITEPLEESINGIAGIRSLTSTSRDGSSIITVEFNVDIDLEAAANDVRDRVSRAQRLIPQDADPPVVTKADADAIPIVMINVSGKERDILQLSDYAKNVLKERIQTIPGVSAVQIWGEKKYSMRLWLDPIKMNSFNITPVEVRKVLQAENIELPSGRLEGDNTELTVRTLGLLQTPKDFNNLIIRDQTGQTVRLSDIGHAEYFPENERTILRRDGKPMIGMVLIPLPGSNHIQIADEFYKRLEQIKKDLPSDIEIQLGFDRTTFIRKSISEVMETIFIAFGLVIVIIFAFLRNWRSTIIPILAIPISLIGAFFIMYAAGFSINVLTLLGIVLAIGIVVDDAIVVLENIYRKIEEGLSPIEAAVKGSSEIFFAIISTTASLASVFLPIVFLQGLTGKLFKEFGYVIAGSVIISAFVALTLTPMMSSRLLKSQENRSWLYNKTEPFFVGMSSLYRKSLEAFMRARWLAIPIMAISAFIIFWFGSNLPTELAPQEDRGQFRISSTAPEGSSFDFMDHYMLKLNDRVAKEVPEKDNITSVTSPGFGASSTNSGFMMVLLKDREERTRSQQEIAQTVTGSVRELNDARTIVIQDQSIGGGSRGGLPVQYVIQAPNYEAIRDILPKFMEEAKKSPIFSVVDVNLKFNKPEVVVEIDRSKARNLGISVSDVATTLQFSLSGQRFGYFIKDGKQYQIIGQLARTDRNKPLDLRSMFVKNGKGDMVQLDNIVQLNERSSPPQLYRFNRFTSATVSAGLAEGKTIGDGIKEMDIIADRVLDDKFSTALQGASQDFVDSSSSLFFTFLLAIVLIYLVLAAQFESFRDPFIIMFTVPLAIAGAVLSLSLFGQTLNIFSEIGQIMLIGLVTKNGILIVEFANQRREAGSELMVAVTEAAELRFRPILMTSLSTILGATPIALALGAGSESRVSMGIAIIGGLIFSTILTLYIIPAMYSYLSPKKLNILPDLDELEKK
ncbi:MAG: efflux RND transporter permease subunit [Ignavibacteriales bacterium]|nr:MAG: efflux RND transporter permease subunit [Ignavibacteriaceae bacterium]MBW7872942.1 efflux RND transporter permease subunit [Ignavibacteria bacterium]MCZ2142429.1 efflux RND transporter permease subunit [Ignavibacteriales bacterium]MBV6445311.1 Efflux pump membrane transporter BepE [Ignavibacteriaceae bacterium]MBZ0196399.1 efflux RND transporter permease subunit [Ignavibacteriaceae bacterium]